LKKGAAHRKIPGYRRLAGHWISLLKVKGTGSPSIYFFWPWDPTTAQGHYARSFSAARLPWSSPGYRCSRCRSSHDKRSWSRYHTEELHPGNCLENCRSKRSRILRILSGYEFAGTPIPNFNQAKIKHPGKQCRNIMDETRKCAGVKLTSLSTH
jgi:hypothetical protein